MKASIQTKLFSVVAITAAIPPLTLMSQVAFNPEFDIAIHCGYLVTWGALGAILFLGLALISGACDCFQAGV